MSARGKAAAAKQQAVARRVAEVRRTTRETDILARIDLDGTGRSDIQTGIGFLDHMLDQLARHGLFDLKVQASQQQDKIWKCICEELKWEYIPSI